MVEGVVMARSEKYEQEQIQLWCGRINLPLWQNTSGVLPDQNGRPVRFGLGNVSAKVNAVWKSSDLIGIYPRVIRQEDVGKMIGQFLAVEVKREGWRGPTTKHELGQERFHQTVQQYGGLAMFAAGHEDFLIKMGFTNE